MTATPRPAQQHTQPTSLTATRRTVAQLRAQGFSPVPLRNWGDAKNRKAPRKEQDWQCKAYTEDDWQPGEGIGTRLGKQRNGLYLYFIDADSHTAHQDAPQYLRYVESRISPALNAKLAKAISTGGNGRYIAFYSRRAIPNGTIHDEQGRKAGEFLGEGRQVVYIEPQRWLHRDYTTIVEFDDQEVDELLTALNFKPARTKGTTQHTEHTPITCDDPTVQHWYEHAQDIEDEGGAPRGIGQGISRNLLTGKAPITNASEARFIVMYRMYQAGYTDAQILGYAMRRCDWNRQGWKLRDDCERILGKLKIEMPVRLISPAAKRRDEQITGIPVEDSRGDNNSVERAKRSGPGRPAAHPEQKLLAYLTQDGEHGVFDDTNEMLAAALYCDVRTIKRYLNTLEQQGKIERRYAAGRRIIVLTPEKQGDTNSTVVAVQDRQDERIPARESSGEAGTEETRVSSPPPAEFAASDPQPTLGEAIAWAFTVLRTNKQRVTLKRVRDWITGNVPCATWAAHRVKSAYRAHRKHEQRQGSAEYWQRLDAMTVQELQRAVKSVDRRIGVPSEHARRSRAQNIRHRKNLLLVLERKLAAAKREASQRPPLPMLFEHQPDLQPADVAVVVQPPLPVQVVCPWLYAQAAKRRREVSV